MPHRKRPKRYEHPPRNDAEVIARSRKVHYPPGQNIVERYDALLDLLRPFVTALAAPKYRFLAWAVCTEDMHVGSKRRFNRLAESLPGLPRDRVLGWLIPCTLLRRIDPDRATTAWRSLDVEDPPDGRPE